MLKFVSPGYMRTLGGGSSPAAISRGKNACDLRPVAMVSENLARELWREPSAALGKRIRPYRRVPGARWLVWSATRATTR
jgi:hypothetical protein